MSLCYESYVYLPYWWILAAFDPATGTADTREICRRVLWTRDHGARAAGRSGGRGYTGEASAALTIPLLGLTQQGKRGGPDLPVVILISPAKGMSQLVFANE